MRRPLAALLVATLLCQGCSLAVTAVRAMGVRASRREILVDQIVRGDTRQPDRERAPRCASHGNLAVSDQGWTFVATHNTRYTVRVRAVHDATVSVFDGDRELRCDDDGAALSEPRTSFDARAGRAYTIVVDGFRAERGPYELVLSR